MSHAATRDPAAEAPGHPECQVCAPPGPRASRGRDDDRHCTFCGRTILHLRLGDPSGEDEDGVVDLYHRPGEPLQVEASWGRGRAGSIWEWLPVALEPSGSVAEFPSTVVPGERFRVVEASTRAPGTATVTLGLIAEGPGPAAPPPRGIHGRLVLATSAGIVRRPARLLPRPESPFRVEAADEGHEVWDPIRKAPIVGDWQVHHRGRDVALPLRIEAVVALRLTRIGDPSSTLAVRVSGLEPPIRLEPGSPRPIELRFDSSGWRPGQVQEFSIPLEAANLGPCGSIAGRVRLGDGRELIVKPEQGILIEDMIPGQSRRAGFLLSAEEDAAGEESGRGVKIVDYSIRGDAASAGWLRVVSPLKEKLPWEIGPESKRAARELEIRIDASRLKRDRSPDGPLEAWIDLRDDLRRLRSCRVAVTFRALAELKAIVAFDWGTSNSCAAYRIGGESELAPTEIPLSEDRDRPEEFSSDLYFVDVSDRDEPEFLIGSEAVVAASRKPHCSLRSFKRKFHAGAPVRVVDESNRIAEYPVERIARLVLHQLVGRAEAAVNMEIRALGLTFPTKWNKGARDRLARVAEALSGQLGVERGVAVTVEPPTIDEANAVAIHLLTSAELPEHLGDHFHLIAYDFGGGTIDTSLLEVIDDGQVLRTRYVGLGGLSNFGGDEVTRAALMLLVERMADALDLSEFKYEIVDKMEAVARVSKIPLVADVGDVGDLPFETMLNGIKNWSSLWEVAEEIKFRLCRGEGDPIRSVLENAEKAVVCQVSIQEPGRYDESLGAFASPPPRTEFRDLGWILARLGRDAADAFYREVRFDLDAVYDHELHDVEGTNEGRRFTIRGRIQDTIDELAWQCAGAPGSINPDVIILAGGGCRLPLVAALMHAKFGGAAAGRVDLLHSAEFSKRRVAHGMASYLYFQKRPGLLAIRPARSVDVLHHHLGLEMARRRPGKPIASEVVPIARAGSPISDRATWHPFRFHRVVDESGRLTLNFFVQAWRGSRPASIPAGSVDFARVNPPVAGDPPMAAAAPPPSDDAYEAGLRLLGLDRVEIRVGFEGRFHGPFPLDFGANDPESLLQG